MPENVDYAIALSTDQTFDASDRVIYRGTIGTGSLGTVLADVPLPLVDALAPGDYYFVVRVDPDGKLDEVSTGNNAASSGRVHLDYPPLADLSVSEVILPSSAKPGGDIAIQYRVSNVGLAAAEGSWVERVYLSTDNAIGNDLLVGEFAQAALWAWIRSCGRRR